MLKKHVAMLAMPHACIMYACMFVFIKYQGI